MRGISALFAIAVLASCVEDHSGSKRIPQGVEYALIEMNGAAFDERATILFGADGGVSGQAPCNRYFGQVSSRYPRFALNGVGATMMACPALDTEAAFFAALEGMTLANVSGGTLTLSNPAGETLVFAAP